MHLTPSPENIRAEMARYKIDRPTLCRKLGGIHVNTLSNYVGGYRSIPDWFAHNVGWAINCLTELPVFDVDMVRGLVDDEWNPTTRGAGIPYSRRSA